MTQTFSRPERDDPWQDCVSVGPRSISGANNLAEDSLGHFLDPTADPAGSEPDVRWFDAKPDDLPRARRYVIARLHAGGADRAALGAAELLVSELFTNVLRHTSSTRVGVTVSFLRGDVRVAISEDCKSSPDAFIAAADEPADNDATHGRGLGILDWLAETWGMTREERITSTWFQLASGQPHTMAPEVGNESLTEALAASARRTEMLGRLTTDLGRSTTPEEVAAAITRHLRGHVDAVFASLALIDSDGRTMTYLSMDPLPADTAERWHTFDLDRTAPCGAAAIDKTPYFHETSDTAEADFPGIAGHMATAGTRALAHLPLTAANITFGTLGLAWEQETPMSPDQRALLLVVAGYSAHALAHAKSRVAIPKVPKRRLSGVLRYVTRRGR